MQDTVTKTKAPQARALPYAPAQQRRGIRSERKLLLAAQALFAEHGYAQTRISDIIARAGVSNGSFYHRFTDKASLFRAIAMRYTEEAARQIAGFDTAPAANGSVAGLLRNLARMVEQAGTENTGFYRASLELEAEMPEVRDTLNRLTLRLCDRLAAAAADYAPEISGPDPAQAMRLAAQTVIMIVLQVRSGTGPAFPRDSAALIEIAMRAGCGQLGILPPETVSAAAAPSSQRST